MLVAIGLALAISACGGDDAGSPLDEALGYLPADSAVAVAVSTDLESDPYQNLDAALQRFGVPGGLEAGLSDAFEYTEVSFSSDVKPLLGNDLVVGFTSFGGSLIQPADEPDDLPFTAAIEVTDGEQAIDLLAGIEELEEGEEIDGATVFGPAAPEVPEGAPEPEVPPGPAIAVDEDALVVAESHSALEAALERAEAGEGLDESTFEERLGELPEDAIVRASADAQVLLDAAGADVATAVPWIGALESFGFTATVGAETANLDVLATSSEVAEEDLPIAAGPEGPNLLADESSIANRDQAQTLRFLLDAIEASVPSAAFDEVAGDLADQVGTELPQLAAAFGGGVRGQRANEEVFSRTEVEDPDAVARALDALKDEVPRLQELSQDPERGELVVGIAAALLPAVPLAPDTGFPPGTKVEPVRGEPDLYRLPQPPTPLPAGLGQPAVPPEALEQFEPPELVFGLIDDVFVTASSVELARRVAAEEPSEAAALPGAIAGSFPLDAADLELDVGEGGGVTLTVLELGIEATSKSVRLRLEAGL